MSKRKLFLFFVVIAALIAAIGMPTTSSDSNDNTTQTYGVIVGRNVNMVSGTDFIGGDPYLQRQNEPSIAVSTRNPLHLLAGANDYRTVDMFIPGEELPGVHQGMAAADAWLGVFKSFDGGESWISMLLPGSLVDDSRESLASPLFGYQAAADPVVRAGTNGLFYYSGITFNRGQRGLGAVFVARFIDNNNKETGDPIEYLDTTIVDVGNPGHFIDKSWIAVDIPRVESPTTVLPNGQEVPCGNVYIVYTSFMGDTEEDVHGKLMFSMSIDCGATWSKPAQITDAGQPYQAATLAINPRDGRPYVAWRRFAKDKTDAIMMAWAEQKGKETVEGYWHEKIKFSKPIVVAEIAPFDQPTMHTMFRTNTYPTMTIDNNGIVYLAWAERNAANYARVVVKTFDPNTGTWYGPTQICSEDSYVWGHQFMPSLSYAAGKVTLVWYDQRYDTSGVPSYYIDDTEPNQWRHTIDVRAAQSDPGPNPDFSNSIQVSKYPWLLYLKNGELWAMQLKHNKPNLDLFMQGTRPFIGDYIDLCPSPPFVPNGNGGWVHNTELIDNPVFYAVWGDNRDVIESDDWINYVAPKNCTEGFEGQTGIRNQNIYTSRLSRGIIAGSPGNTKPLNIKRAFVVFIKNTTEDPKELTLTIVAPTGVTAKFQELGEEYGELDITVPPYSTTSTTVSVYQNLADKYASVTVKIWDNGNLLAQVVLNPDSTNPWIEEPDVGYEAPHVAATNETHTPHVAAYQVIEWDYESANPHVAAPHVAAPHVAAYSVNDDWVTPHVAAPHVAAPHVAAPHVAATNIINPHVAATSFPEDIPEDSSLTDVYIGVENVGNTTSSYSISTLPVDIPAGILVQLLVYRVYTTPSAVGCELVREEHHELLSNITPHVAAISPTSTSENLQANILNTDIPVDATAVIPPGGRVIIMYRILDEDKYDDIKVEPTSFVPQITQDAKDIIEGNEQPGTPPPALIITTPSLPDGTIGQSYPTTTLEATGGYGSYTWDLAPDSDSLPTWLSFSPNGVLSAGSTYPDTLGTFTFKFQVQDSPPSGISQQTTTKPLSITVRPAPATLIFPDEGAELDNGCDFADENIEWDFDWSDVSGATKYHLYVQHTGAEFPLIDNEEVTASEYHYVDSGYITDANRLDWKWKVRALVSGIWSEWSAERSFDVEPLNTDCVVVEEPPLTLEIIGGPNFTVQQSTPEFPCFIGYPPGSKEPLVIAAKLTNTGDETFVGVPSSTYFYKTAESPVFLSGCTGEINGYYINEGDWLRDVPASSPFPGGFILEPGEERTFMLHIIYGLIYDQGATCPETKPLTSPAVGEKLTLTASEFHIGIGELVDGQIVVDPESPQDICVSAEEESFPIDVTVIAADTGLNITTTTLPNVLVGWAYPTTTLTATDGVAPLTWINIGSLPDGLTLSSDGIISGTPTTLGIFQFAVQATDSSNPPQMDTQVLRIIVVLDNVPNPSFELGDGTWPDGWEPAEPGQATFVWDDDYAYDGLKSVGIGCSGGCLSYNSWRMTDFIAIDPTKDYRLSVKYYWDNTPNENEGITISIYLYNANGRMLIGLGVPVYGDSASKNWQEISFTTEDRSEWINNRDETFMIKIYLQRSIHGSPNTSATVRFDKVRFSVIE